MSKFLQRLADRFDGILSGSMYSDEERYLSQSTDANDLERRMLELQRNRSQGFWNPNY